ncbi:hypothetical protein PRIPAC_76855 [Pristionchus pacificus]|nr:hypothetical protein PRIPAC_76855 [Pristionchus pacificus]
MLLIFTIKTTTTMSTDNYRYLLLCFAVGDMISSLTHSYISPIVHLTEHGFFFFPKHANELKSENAALGKFVCLFYIFTYYETFNILACHFIYRYKRKTRVLDDELAAGSLVVYRNRIHDYSFGIDGLGYGIQ